MDQRTSTQRLRIEKAHDALQRHGLAAVLVPSTSNVIASLLAIQFLLGLFVVDARSRQAGTGSKGTGGPPRSVAQGSHGQMAARYS